MNVWKAFLLLQVSANPLSTNEQTGPAAMCKPIRNRQELPGRQAGSNQCLGVSASGENSFPGEVCMAHEGHRLRACELLLVPPSHLLPQAKTSPAAHERSLHHDQQGSTSAAGGEPQGTRAFSAGIHLLLCDSVLAAVLRS